MPLGLHVEQVISLLTMASQCSAISADSLIRVQLEVSVQRQHDSGPGTRREALTRDMVSSSMFVAYGHTSHSHSSPAHSYITLAILPHADDLFGRVSFRTLHLRAVACRTHAELRAETNVLCFQANQISP